MEHTLKWFKNRTKKRIYRLTKTNCCDTCRRVEKEGIVVNDDFHAEYLFDCQNSMKLVYSDRPVQNPKNKKTNSDKR